MLNNRRTTRKYAIYSLCLVILFLMVPMTTNPGDQFHSNTNPDPSYFDGMNLAAGAQDYTDSSTSDIDGSPDIGTHSSFPSQQVGPDSTYDTLNEANADPAPTNSEDDIDSDTSDVDSTPDQGIEGTFANAQGTTNDSSYFAINEESVISAYGGETGSVFVTGALPDMAGRDQFCFYQAIFWNPTDDVYEISRVEFNYTGSLWLKAISQGSGSSSPTSEWSLSGNQVAYWAGSSVITVQPHTANSFYVRGDSNKIRNPFYVDIRITANSSTYTESYNTEQFNQDRTAAQLWLGSSLPPTQIHSVAPGVQTTVYVSLEEDANDEVIESGGTLTIDVPAGFTGITDVGGTNWGTATINGNQITVSNTATILGSYITYAFTITSPSTPGLYKLDVAFDDGYDAHPIGNFTVHVTGTPTTVEKVNTEYQWTTATYDATYENVSIYVGSHTGSENLLVNYWDGFTWNVLGTISSTGWTNFTATGLTSSTYTIQFLGSSESSDSSKDTWNIDLITLHTWSVQTYNYKLDLEIQWSSASFAQDYEELCIYAGSLDTESIRVDVWAGADWTNIATDLTANSWNNFSIGTWLTSATFTIRFRGDLEVGDTSQSSWEIDCSLLHTWDNNVPQNTAAPTISNLDDTSFLYAEYRQYQITVNVTDEDGFAEIDYLELTLTSNDELTEYWTVRYDEDTDLFTEQSDPSNYITLDAGSSSSIESGNDISATFFITINWNHPDIVDTDAKSEVYDANPSSSLNYYEVDWDVETRLDMSSGPTLTDGSGTPDRGDVDGSLTASGTITYFGSALHPSASDIDIWISSAEYGTQSGPWEATNYEHVGGTFSATVYADDLVGNDTYTFKAVLEGSGAGGSDHFGSSQTDDYIADRVQVQSYSTDDSRIDVNSSASLHAVLWYAYDNSTVTDGTVTINELSANYNVSTGVWDFSDEKSTVQLFTYDTLAYSGGAHGITVEDQNSKTVDQIWDYVKVVSYSVIDARVDISSDATVDVTLVYEYDSSFVVDGTVTVNGISATHQGSGVWRFTDNMATVQGFTFNLVVASGNANGITLVDQNSQSQLIIWDRVIVTSYSVADNRVNIDDTVNLDVTLLYEHDSAPVTDGSVTINLVAASHTGGGVWRITVSKSTVRGVTYDSIACSGNTHGITVVNQNSQSQLIIWDQITVRSYSTSDGRVGLDDSVNIDVTIEYEYDDSDVINGSVSINSLPATHQGSGVWRVTDSKSSVQSFTYDLIVCSGNGPDITSVNQNSQSTSVIWDQVIVRGYEVSDTRDNVGEAITITVELEYDYDDSDAEDGTVTINGLPFTYTGFLGKWSASRTQVTVTDETFATVVVSGNAHGITDVDTNGQSQTVIWDRIQVSTTTVDDSRIDTDTSCEIRVTLILEYDSTPLGTGDTVILNGVAMTWDGGDSRFELNQSQSSVDQWLYFVNSSTESTYGITALNLNSQDVSVIWDQIRILTTTVDDDRVSVDSNAELRVTAELAYDGHTLGSGDSIVLDSASMTWDGGNGWFDVSRTKSDVGLYNFQVESALENDFGISVVDLNGQSQDVIWDRLAINIVADMDSVANSVQVNFTMTVTFEYDLTACTTYNIQVSRNATYWHTFIISNISTFDDTQSDTVYNYTATLVVSETTYGITVFSPNVETVEWGGIITAPVNDVAPVLTNPDDSDFMYAKLRFYIITSNVSDAQGYDTINYVELSLWDNTGSSEIWRIRYTEATNAFSVELGTIYIQLIGSTYVKSGNDIDITWSIKIDWDHPDLSNVDFRQYVEDTGTDSDDNWYEVNYDVETQLDYSDSPSLSDDRGDLNTNDLECTGTIVYYGSSLSPLSNETDVWVVHGVSGEWTSDVDISGVFTVFSIGSSASVGLNTYTIKIVITGDGSGGTDLYYTTSLTDTFITDQIEFYQSGSESGRININDNGNVWWNVRYDYDDVAIVGGLTAQLNGSKALLWDGVLTRWYYQETLSDVGLIGYEVASASESGYGLSGWVQTASDVSIIWDKIIVRSYNAADLRINVSDTVAIDVLLEYEFDDSYVADGTVTINSISAVYQGSGLWRISESSSSVVSVTYNTVACPGNTHGITTVDQNSQLIAIVWDRIIVQSYSVSDNRTNIGESVNINVTLRYVYDITPVLDGSVTINGLTATHLGAGVWRIIETKITAQSVTYDTVACSGNTHGIAAVNQSSQSQVIIWDQIVVQSYTVLDSRVNVDDTVNVDIVLEYAYDNTDVNDGTVSINGVSATHQSGSVWRISVSESIVGSNTYNSVACSSNAYDITTVDQNTQSIEVIWDQITVRSYSASDTRDNVGSTITVSITLEFEYDDYDVENGSVIVNSIPFTYTGSNGVWSANRLQNSVTSETYNSTVASGNTLGISDINQNGMSITVIWDRIRILTTTVDDSRLNTDDTARIMVTAELEYDGHLLGLGDTLFLDDLALNWDNGNGWFYIDVTQSTIGLWSHFVNTTGALESTYSIFQITVAGQSQDVIWDELSITIIPDATDVNDYDTVTFTLAVTFSYDSSSCTSYIVDISRNGSYWLSFTTANVSQFEDDNIALAYLYTSLSVSSESTYGITVFSNNTATVTWSTPTNFAPFNNGAPTLVNPDDSDNMYAKLGLYFITSSIVDYDGYLDVDYVELSLWDDNKLFEVWRVRYTTSTQVFSIEVGTEYIQLSASSSNLSISFLLNITWAIKIDWDHFDLQNVDVQQYVIDSDAVSDDDWFEVDWDVETRLDYSTAPYLSDDRGDLDTIDLQASGTVIYYGSLLSPMTNETDIWVIHDFSGSWSGNVSIFGELSVSGIGSSSNVRLNTYTFKIVEAGLGHSSADLFYTTSPIDTFITDRIEFYLSGVADPRINIDTLCDVWWSAKYQYDNTDIESGLTAYLNGINLISWDSANSRWNYQVAQSSSVNLTYQISGAIETVFGITSWVQTADDQSVVWDSLIISITDPLDQRTNVNTNATGISVSAIYSYDSTPFDGTILLNNDTFQYSTVHRQYYTAVSASGDSHGITVIVVNDQTWCIWDQIEVVSIMTNITYLDPTEYVRVQVELRFDFDDAPVTSGNFSLKFEELVHLADGIWEMNVTRPTYSTVNFDTLTVCEATTFGITSFDMYGNEQVVYWDRLEFFVAYTTDSRIDVGSTGFIIWSIKLQTAGINITSGVIAEVSDGSILTYVSDNWRSAHSSDLVEDITFTMVSASLEGIDFFVRSTSDVTIIWDRIKVVSTSATLTNPEIEKYIQIQATLVFEYDNSPLIDGVVTLWDQDSQMSMIYNASGGFWFANLTKVEPMNYTFYISAVSGNAYGITVVEIDGNMITVEFIPTILPRLTPLMIATITSGFGIILLVSAILIRKKYLIKVPYEIKQINQALKSMEDGEPVEPLDIRSIDNILIAVLEPGLVELGLSPEEIHGVDISVSAVEESWVPDSDAELVDIMDEFKIPEYKRELDEGELDISILSESESEEAWSVMLKEVRRIETEEGRKIPLTKEDWIERIPSEIKSIFFEEELRELDISELEHLTQLTPDEVRGIVDSIAVNEEMYTLEPETSASAISSALGQRLDSEPTDELDETEKKERLFQLLPTFVKEFFSTTWLDKLSSAEIEELLTIPEDDLKIVIQSLKESRDAEVEIEEEPMGVTEAEPEVELKDNLMDELKIEPDAEDEIESEAKLKADLLAELKFELESEVEAEPEVELKDDLMDELKIEPDAEVEAEPEVDVAKSVIEYDDPRMTEFVEKYGEEKANILITIPEFMLEGIPEEKIKEMDIEIIEGLREALDEAERDVAPEDESEPEE